MIINIENGKGKKKRTDSGGERESRSCGIR